MLQIHDIRSPLQRQRPEAFADSLRKLVRATDAELAIDDLRSMDTRIAPCDHGCHSAPERDRS